MIESNRISKIVYRTIMITLIICGLFFSAANNLDYTGIWYDETASFWISQGLHNYSEINEPGKGIRKVILENRYSNLDPGGHSVLLHFWTIVRQDIVWLRLLSFTFFLFSVIAMGFLAWEWTSSFVISLFAMFLPFAYDPILYYAFEIRAYSMEIAGIILGSLFLARFFNKPNFSNLLILGILCALFMWFRYTYIVFVLAASCSCLFFVFTKPNDECKRLLSISYAFWVPVIVSGLLIFYVSLWYHLNHGMSLDYMSKWIAKGKSFAQLLHFFKINFFSFPALPTTAALLAFFVLRPFVRRFFPRFYTKIFHAGFSPDIAPFYWLILTAQIFFFLISIAGYTPWDISKMWSLHLIGISMIAALLLITECFRIFLILYKKNLFCCLRLIGKSVPIFALMVAGLLAFHAATYRHIYKVNLASAIEYLNSLNLSKGSVFVAGYEIPAIRYLYEFGPYKDSDKYPYIFRFQKGSEWDKSVTINAAAEGLQYFITVQSPEDLTKRLVEREAKKVAGVPHLLMIEPSK